MSQMTHKERIIASLDHKPVDRIATDYWGVDEVTAKLMSHFSVNNMMDLADAMDIDKIIEVRPQIIVDRPNMLGLEMKMIPLPDGNGFYEEPVSHPLEDCEDIDDVLQSGYVFPSVDMFDYSVVAEQCKKAADRGFAVDGGYISLTYFYELIRGTENMLVDFIANPELARYILDRLQEFAHENTKKILEAGNGLVTVSQVTDDLGSQDSLLMSPTMIDEYLARYYEANIALVKSFDARVFHHDDGAMCEMLPWLVDKGIEVLNPLQWHLPGWDLPAIKKQYGDKLCFHGGVDNQYVLPRGTMEELHQEVNDCMDALFTDGTGYILGPCHNVQANTSIEKVLNMYKFAREYKR